ncbi:MAG: YeeE/YedE thiosulfate transporter family protein [Candidatus Brocadiia bacterium]
MRWLKEKAWSPYAAGLIIGLLQIPAFLIIRTALGASSSYVSGAGYVASVFDRDVQQIAYFNKYMTSMKYAWQSSMLIGIAIGAYLSVRWSSATRESFSPIWRKALGINTLARRLAVGFIGGFLMLFGARWAGGCTSGHGLSGVAQLAVGSLVVAVGMFAGGIVVANLFRRL